MKIKTIFGQTKIPHSDRTKESTIWEKWEEDRLLKLKENYPTVSEKEIIEKYNQNLGVYKRSSNSIRSKLRRLVI